MILVIILFSLVHYGSMYSSIKCMEGRYKKEKNHTCHFDANRKPYCELFIHESDTKKDHNHKGCGKFEPHFIPYDYCRSKTLISIVSFQVVFYTLVHMCKKQKYRKCFVVNRLEKKPNVTANVKVIFVTKI